MADVAYLHSIWVGLSDELLHFQDGPAMQGELALLLWGHNTLASSVLTPTAPSAGGQDLDALVIAGYHQSQPTNVSKVPLVKPQERETKDQKDNGGENPLTLPCLHRCDNPIFTAAP